MFELPDFSLLSNLFDLTSGSLTISSTTTSFLFVAFLFSFLIGVFIFSSTPTLVALAFAS